MIEQGGDWDRRNRLKVYEAMYSASIRKFKESADLLLEGLATFTSYELCSYNQFIFYTVLMAAVSIDRVNLKNKALTFLSSPHEPLLFLQKEFLTTFLAIAPWALYPALSGD